MPSARPKRRAARSYSPPFVLNVLMPVQSMAAVLSRALQLDPAPGAPSHLPASVCVERACVWCNLFGLL